MLDGEAAGAAGGPSSGFHDAYHGKCWSSEDYAGNCTLGFGDGGGTDGSGCSDGLKELIALMPACKDTTKQPWRCACVPDLGAAAASSARVDQERLVAAVDFHDAAPTDAATGAARDFSARFANFTVYSAESAWGGGVDWGRVRNGRYQSPLSGEGNPADWSGRVDRDALDRAWTEGFLPMAGQVYAALLAKAGGPAWAVATGSMGSEPWLITAAEAIANLPFYLTFLFCMGVTTIVFQVVQERGRKLEQGMFMCGLEPAVYWWSWFVVGLLRQLLTIVIALVIVPTFLFKFSSVWVLLLGMLVFGWYTIALALTWCTFFTKAKPVVILQRTFLD